MVSFEGPLLGWLLGFAGPWGRRIRTRLVADHQAITNVQANPSHTYMAFYAFVAVAPSKLVKPLPVLDLMDQADEFVHSLFPGVFPREPEYAGHELVRYVALPTREREAETRIIFYPSGLIELHWCLATPPQVLLPLDQLVDVVQRVRDAVASGAFQRLHRRRRWARRRKVDWRIGINPYAAISNNSISWATAGPPDLAPTRRDPGRRPSCPPEGYAASQLRSAKPTATLRDLLTPAMTELLAAGGYSGGEAIRASVARYVDRGMAPRELPGGVGHTSEVTVPGSDQAIEGDVGTSLLVPAGLTAKAVVEAFAARGLPTPNPRDNSHSCNSLGCCQMITTDMLTVVQFDDATAAAQYADAIQGDAHRHGHIVLSYAAARTAPDVRPQYEDALDALFLTADNAAVMESTKEP